MKSVYSTILAAIVLLATMCGLVFAQPPTTHALIHIKNESAAKATLYFKWGNHEWQQRTIERGHSAYFNWGYDGTSKNSPDFFVRLDVDTNGVKFVEHILTPFQSPDDNGAKYGSHYVIKQVQGTDTRYIDGVEPKAVVRVTDSNSSRPHVK